MVLLFLTRNYGHFLCIVSPVGQLLTPKSHDYVWSGSNTTAPPNQEVPGSSFHCGNRCQRPKRVTCSSGLQGTQPTPPTFRASSSSAITMAPRQISLAPLHSLPQRNMTECVNQRVTSLPTERRGRGMNKGDPLVTNEAAKIEINVDFKNGGFVEHERIMRTIGVHVKLELEE